LGDDALDWADTAVGTLRLGVDPGTIDVVR